MIKRRWYLVIAGVVIVAILASLWFYFRKEGEEGIFEASGQVRGTEVTIGSKLAGRVESLKVKEGQAIKAGDLIAKISSEEIEARIEQGRAQVDASRNRLKEVGASIKRINTSIEQAQVALKFVREDSIHRIHQAREATKRTEADVKEAESQRDLTKSDYDRYSDLMKKGLVSKSEFEGTEARFRSSEARLGAVKKGREEAKAALERAEASSLEVKAKEKEYKGLLDERERVKASYETAKNQMDEAAARVKEIEAAFKDTELYAPSRGTVINKLVEEGELVAVGTSVATLIDLSDIYVKVYIPEKDIGKIRIGNQARLYADAFPGRSFEGNVTEISQKAEFTPKEVHMKEERTKLVFGVKVGIKNPEGYLKPGMPVDVKIKWMEDAVW